MKIVATSTGDTLDAPVSPLFGRCPSYLVVDTDTLEFQAVQNPAAGAAGGAGIQAAQFVVQQGAEAVITGNVGPNAYGVLAAAGLTVYRTDGSGTVRQAVEDLKEGKLPTVGSANVPGHFGTRSGMGRGRRST